MNLSYTRWKQLFIFCSGLAMAAFFCMKSMENDLWVNDEKFTILGLELFYSKEKLTSILSHIDEGVRMILNYHLHFDFVLMAGIFPGISSLCMMAREKVVSPTIKKLLFILAAVQLLAWAGDITENLYLLKWVSRPVIGDEFVLYHFIVASKWILALSGFIIAFVLSITHFKTKTRKRIS